MARLGGKVTIYPGAGIGCAAVGNYGAAIGLSTGRLGSRTGKGRVVKRIRMLTLLGMLAVVLPIGLLQGVAKASDQGSSPNQVSIQPKASYITAGFTIDVGLYVRCQGGSGEVIVDVTQSQPETPYPVAFGSGPQAVVCDGHTHSVAVTVAGTGTFDSGTAWATADLMVGSPTVAAHDQRSINIVVVTG